METFIKVYIKSEDDLPKEDGVYFVCYKKYKENATHYWRTNLARKNTWLAEIDWYLKPVELPEITDEEIEAKASDLADPSSHKDFSRGEWLGFKEGGRWYRSELKKRMT